MLAFARTSASKIETQDRQAAAMQRLRGLVHDLVVHRAAIERMGMANERGHWRICIGRSPEQSLELASGTVQEKIAMKCVSHKIVYDFSVTKSRELRKATVKAVACWLEAMIV